MKTFADIFKKSFLNDATMDVNLYKIFMSLLAAFICGMIIYFVYKYFYKGVLYSHSFNILLVLVSMITAFIVLTISSNIVLSLGMVGALSIVRFRTAVKDPLDVGFLFFAISIGITCGAGLYLMSFICTIVISLIYILMVKVKTDPDVYLLIIKYDRNAGEEVNTRLAKMKYAIKNKTVFKDSIELTLEMKLKNADTDFVAELSNIEGVHSAALVNYKGDFAE
ncbi:MAG: DUF4956 domain-containing protein [Clostridiales bacterium]|jgi:uncharacterized membrane protein YhiD involved in acid resistance|nr:DUF4956 domain-containing protein [Clostridiales bacterium]